MGQVRKQKLLRVAKKMHKKKRVYTPMQIRVMAVSAALERERQAKEVMKKYPRKKKSPALKARSFFDWDQVCPGCGLLYPKLTKHHITPVSCQGGNHKANLIMICWDCHAAVHEYLNTCGKNLKEQEDEFFREAMELVLKMRSVI